MKQSACILLCLFAAIAAAKPNVIVIMTDDMGFSDLGCYGSEIETPHLDALAARGLRFTQFYNTGRCCPTRGSLMTGLYAHQAGVGAMSKDEGPKRPGYRGRLTDRCVTIAEVLRPAGYLTIQTGKWHLGGAKKEWWPNSRGFDRSFGTPLGGGFYFRPRDMNRYREVVRNFEVVYTPEIDPPKNWYTTDAFTDEGLAWVREAVAKKQPFFWYLAYNAPHWPLQAKPADIAKYRGRYQQGWDAMRQQRYDRLIKLGIIKPEWPLSPRPKGVPAWDSLSDEQKDRQDLRMATYAAMIDCVDQNVGKLVAELKRLQAYENTLIVFLCDNGGCAEGGRLGSNNTKVTCGEPGSFAKYGECWANVSSAPFRKYKHYMHEGGTATPFIAHWPTGIKAELAGSLIRDPAHVIDLMATCVDLSGATYPERVKETAIIPMEGVSLRPLFEGRELQRGQPLFFEHYGARGIREGKWKLVALPKRKWELYDLEADRTELRDLAAKHPERVQAMAKKYDAWAERAFVNRR